MLLLQDPWVLSMTAKDWNNDNVQMETYNGQKTSMIMNSSMSELRYLGHYLMTKKDLSSQWSEISFRSWDLLASSNSFFNTISTMTELQLSKNVGRNEATQNKLNEWSSNATVLGLQLADDHVTVFIKCHRLTSDL